MGVTLPDPKDRTPMDPAPLAAFVVCVDCSVFYESRFCIECAAMNINEFPQEMQAKVNRKVKEAKKK